jgi:hypothetical protein
VHLATYSGMLAAAAISSIFRGEIAEADAVSFYSTCYREHYLRWMLIVSTFYDQNSGKETYFWEAQRLSTGDINAADAKLAFTNVVAGIEDLKESEHTDLLAEVSTRMRDNLSHNVPDAGDGASPTPFSDLIREEDLACLPAAMGFHVVTQPRLGIARTSGAPAEAGLEVVAA